MSKYGNKKTEFDGFFYDSIKEANKARDLKFLKLGGEIKGWKRQFPLRLDVKGVHICTYVCDFLVTHNDGSEELIEIKSEATAKLPVFRIKWKLATAIYGGYYKMTIEK